MTRTAFARPALFAAAVALAAGAAAPAFARNKPPATITLPEKMMNNTTGRLCMPKEMLGSKATKDMPQTICQPRADWEAQGVTFVVK